MPYKQMHGGGMMLMDNTRQTSIWIHAAHLMLSRVIHIVFENGMSEFILPEGRHLASFTTTLEYLQHHCGRRPRVLQSPLSSPDMNVLCRDTWDAMFMDRMSFDEIVEILDAANFLDIPSLFTLCCAKLATLFMSRSRVFTPGTMFALLRRRTRLSFDILNLCVMMATKSFQVDVLERTATTILFEHEERITETMMFQALSDTFVLVVPRRICTQSLCQMVWRLDLVDTFSSIRRYFRDSIIMQTMADDDHNTTPRKRARTLVYALKAHYSNEAIYVLLGHLCDRILTPTHLRDILMQLTVDELHELRLRASTDLAPPPPPTLTRS